MDFPSHPQTTVHSPHIPDSLSTGSFTCFLGHTIQFNGFLSAFLSVIYTLCFGAFRSVLHVCLILVHGVMLESVGPFEHGECTEWLLSSLLWPRTFHVEDSLPLKDHLERASKGFEKIEIGDIYQVYNTFFIPGSLQVAKQDYRQVLQYM